MTTTIEENVNFRGTVQFLGSAKLPTAGIENKHVAADANVDPTKLQHQHRAVYEQESDTSAASETRVIHVVHGTTGTLKAIKAGCVVANIGAATITVDLLKNGVSVLTAAITLDSGQSAYQLVAGTIDTTALAVGDVLEIDITATAGGGTLGKGVFCYVDLHEKES